MSVQVKTDYSGIIFAKRRLIHHKYFSFSRPFNNLEFFLTMLSLFVMKDSTQNTTSIIL